MNPKPWIFIALLLAAGMAMAAVKAKPQAAPPVSRASAQVLEVYPYEKSIGTASRVKGVFKKDLRTVVVKCGLLNHSYREVRATRGTLRFTTYFNEPIFDMPLEAVLPIKPGARVSMTWNIKRKHFETDEAFKKFADTPLDKMRFIYVPTVVVFADGTEYKP